MSRDSSILGVLTQMGGGLRDYQKSGQLNVLLDYVLQGYLEVFDKVYLFSYFDESLSDYTRDPTLLSRVVVLPKRNHLQHKLYGVLVPWMYRRQVRACSVIRVLQATGSLPAILGRLVWGVPYVPSFGYRYAEFARIQRSRFKGIAVSFLERLAARWASVVIVTTGAMEKYVRQLAPSASVVTIPNGVDTRLFAGDNKLVASRWSDSSREVLFVGRLEPEKNLLVLIEALAILRDRVPVRLTLVGDGSMRTRVAQQAETKGVPVAFAGVVPNRDLPEYYRRADVFVLPSRSEGHPKVLLEAMSSGLPCVVSDCEGNRSIAEDEVTGLMHDPQDAIGLAKAIERILTQPGLSEVLAGRARRHVVKNYDIVTHIQSESRLLSSVGRQRRSAEGC